MVCGGVGFVLLCGCGIPTAINRWGYRILLLEEFYEVRCVRKSALVTNLRDRFVGRNQQQPRVHQALAYIPLVRRHLEVSLELLFERRERPIANLGELFDGDVLEHVVIDNLLKVASGNIHIA